MNLSGADRSRQLVTVGVGTLLLLVMGGVLLAGFRLATQMNANVTALQTASVLQTYPSTIEAQLNSLRDRLETRAYAGQALADMRATVDRVDKDMKQLGDFKDSPQVQQALALWQQYGPVIDPVVDFTGQPYVDSDEAGSSLSPEGKTHYADVKRAQLFARENAKRMQGLLAAVAGRLQTEVSTGANRLRVLLSTGVLAALVLAAAAAWLQLTRGRSERAAREAQEQTRDILRTVKEGFFLLDADYKIGSVWSDALTRLFGRSDFAGLAFEELLKDLVPPATLATAMKYIKLLWGDRAHENLMKSINPLGQLEIHVETATGQREARYLQFDFHRVMGPQGVKHVLVSVGDITASVMLAKELQESQENANQQVDMMLGVMHIDPVQLMSFLDATETGLQLVNAIMKEPARSDSEFRKKLDGLFRELHSIKGEASALNLMSVASRTHALEDMVGELKKKPDLSGNDFLPMVLKLDELLAHLRSVRELGSRLSALRDSAPVESAKGAGGKTPGEELAQTLQALAERLAHDHKKKFKLSLSGIADIPRAYIPTLKDVLIQMLRNSAVHGIESAEVRRAHTKDDVGAVRIEFRKGAEGFELMFEDDGAGLLPEQLKAAAVRKQIVTPEEAAAMDTRAAMALIFRPGFSTQEHVSMDAGRGVGMDVVAKSVYAIGGKIGVTTNPGKFTRFKVSLPASSEEASTAVA
ncbi:MAG TPA: ATP-binding protein [Steroidobacteraceae bacterium]|jgi:two-component system chemotaxis sensor kinase CheA|nr:ATP-binding protein [Steroidobacteraceae bacterium]